MEKTLKIHSENILPIIKRWLYSEKDIFVRELVSNATDALHKLAILQNNQEAPASDSPPRIDIRIDATQKTLTFSDNGIGMDAEEVEKYIAQIAFSGAEDFVSKYQTQKEGDQIIGHFGLGFYSSYMIAEKVEIQTLSYKSSSSPVYWSCDGSSNYTIDTGTRSTCGTDVILTVSKEEEEYLDDAKLRQLLMRYCAFLPYSIYLNGTLINDQSPLWIKPVHECTDQEYIDFYQRLFPMDPPPLFWVHLNVDYPFHLKGILYFPQLSKESEFKRDSIKLFCNRVFVSDHCKELFPEYLTILRGVIDSPDIPLNVSRSYLQMDKNVKGLGAHISKKISDRLSAFYRSEREKFLDSWKDIELIIKYGALQDEKFYDRVKEFLVWPTSNGTWTTVEEYIERKNEKTIYYSSDDKLNTTFLELHREKGIEVLHVSSTPMDQALIPLIERKTDVRFQRIDADLSPHVLDPSREKELLDADGRTESSKMADFFRKKLDIENIEVEAKSLASEKIPALLVLKEEQRRFRDSLAFQNKEEWKRSAAAWLKPTFVINTNSRLIQAICSVNENDPELAKEMTLALYDHARLSQKEMDPDALASFLNRNVDIFEKLALKLQR